VRLDPPASQPVAVVTSAVHDRLVRALPGASGRHGDRSLVNAKFTDALERELVECTYATAAQPRRWSD
jgi:hypothetical protein